MGKPIIVIAGILLILITISGCCVYNCGPKSVCGNGECEGKENAFTCAADCSGLASCRIVEHPWVGPGIPGLDNNLALGGDYNFAVEFTNFMSYPRKITSVNCGDGATFATGFLLPFDGNYGKVGGNCNNYTVTGLHYVAQATLQDENSLVKCTGQLPVWVQ